MKSLVGAAQRRESENNESESEWITAREGVERQGAQQEGKRARVGIGYRWIILIRGERMKEGVAGRGRGQSKH